MKKLGIIFCTLLILSPAYAATRMQGKGDSLSSSRYNSKYSLNSGGSVSLPEVVKKEKKPSKYKGLTHRELLVKISYGLSEKFSYDTSPKDTFTVAQHRTESDSGHWSITLEQYHYLTRHWALGYGLSATNVKLEVTSPSQYYYNSDYSDSILIFPIYLGTKYRFNIKGSDYWYVYGQFGTNPGIYESEMRGATLKPYYSLGIGKKWKRTFWELSYAHSKGENNEFAFDSTYKQIMLSVGFGL